MYSNQILQDLNTAQRSAVLRGEGPALIAAGPGSGKTTVITKRILYLIQERKVPPQEILVITFTKEAAGSMQERYLRQVQKFSDGRRQSMGFVSFGTFHSFFYQIIRGVKAYSDYQLISQQEKIKIARAVLKENSQDEVTEGEIREFLRLVSFYKNTGSFEIDVSDQEQDKKAFYLNRIWRFEQRKHSYKRLTGTRPISP